MIKIKAFYKLGVAPDVFFLMSEKTVHRLELPMLPLVKRLMVGLASDDVEQLTNQELEFLRKLNSLGVIRNELESDRHAKIINYLDIVGINSAQTVEQLDHVRLKISNYHSDQSLAVKLKTQLLEFGIKVVDQDQTLTINLVERLNQPVEESYPALTVKLGSYKPTVGPITDQIFTTADLKQYAEKTKACFEQEAFLADLPEPLKELSINIAATEIALLTGKAGKHDGIFSIIEWDLIQMKRTAWKL